MYLSMVYLTAFVMLSGTLYYAVQIVRGVFGPPPGAFIILSASFGLAWFMYTQTPEWSYTGNVGLLSAVISVWSLTGVIILKLLVKGTLAVSFNTTQKRTMIGAGCIVIFWLFTDDPFVSYVLLQALALVGYWPIVKSLHKRQHDDSLILWLSIWVANLVAIYPAFADADLEAYIYIVRAFIGTTAVVALLFRNRFNVPAISVA